MARTIPIEPLKEALDELDDDELILELYDQLGIPLNGHQHEIPQEVLEGIEIAREQHRNGQFKPHHEVMENNRKWLRESFGQTSQIDSSANV